MERNRICLSLALFVPQAPSCLALRKTEIDNVSSPFSSFMTLGKALSVGMVSHTALLLVCFASLCDRDCTGSG